MVVLRLDCFLGFIELWGSLIAVGQLSCDEADPDKEILVLLLLKEGVERLETRVGGSR